jgi:hypothetical protein
VRDQFKGCALAVQYQMGAESLAARIGQPVYRAAELLRLHLATYPVYWRRSDAAMDYARLNRELPSVFGWRLHVTAATKSRTIANLPMQANGAEMLRLVCCLATERGSRSVPRFTTPRSSRHHWRSFPSRCGGRRRRWRRRAWRCSMASGCVPTPS